MNLTTNLSKHLRKMNRKIEDIKIKKFEINEAFDTDRIRSGMNASIFTQKDTNDTKTNHNIQSSISHNKDIDIEEGD